MVRFSRVGLAAMLMCHSQVIRCRQRTRHAGGNTLKYQDCREGFRTVPLNRVECGIFREFLLPKHFYFSSWSWPNTKAVGPSSFLCGGVGHPTHCFTASLVSLRPQIKATPCHKAA